MAISDTITSMYENVGNVYDVLELAGADLTNVDKNILNLKQSWEERLLYFLANGTDVVWNNWLPKVNGTGESITLNNTIQAKMDFVYKGNTSQESTTGKNLINVTARTMTVAGMTITVNNDKSITLNGSYTGSSTYWFRLRDNFTLSAGTYTLSNGNPNVSESSAIFVDDGNNFNARTNIETKTFASEVTIKPYIRIATGSSFANLTIYPMIVSGSSAGEYEPYTGGNPAPNPDYPYPVNVVTGDNEVKVEGKNLFNKNAVTTSKWLNINGELENASNYVVSDYIQLEEGQTYYIPKRSSSRTKYYKADKSVYSNVWDVSDIAQAITIPTGVKYIRMSFLIAGAVAIDLDTVQFEKSSTATTYEPYQSQTYPINLGSMCFYW